MAAVFNEVDATDCRCHICFTRFSKLSKLILHQKKHSELKFFKCKFCSERFSKFSKLTKHQRRHAVHKPLQCEYCYKNFKKPSKLIQHQLKHSEETCLHCHLCLKRFSSLQNYLHHIALDCSKTVCAKLEDRSLNISRSPNETTETERKSKIPAFEDTNAENIKKFDVENVSSDFINLCSVNLSSSDTDCEIIDYVKEESHRRDISNDSIGISSEYQQPQSNIHKASDSAKSISKDVCLQNKSHVFPSTSTASDFIVVDLSSDSSNTDLDLMENSQHLKAGSEFICKYCDIEFAASSDFMDHMKFHDIKEEQKCHFCLQTFSTSSALAEHLPEHLFSKSDENCNKEKPVGTLESTKEKPAVTSESTKEKPVVTLESTKEKPVVTLESTKEKPAVTSESTKEKPVVTLESTKEKPAVTSESTKEKPVLTLESTKEKPVVTLESTSNVGKMEISTLSFPEVDIRTLSQNITNETKEKESVQVNKNEDSAPLKQKVASEAQRKKQANTKKYKCKFCNKSFSSKPYFKDHLNFHLVRNLFFCKVCKKSFSSKYGLKTHQTIHTGERPFVCKVCNKSFSLKSGLETHELIHTGERPFVCKVCNKSFNQSCNLKTHEKIHTR